MVNRVSRVDPAGRCVFLTASDAASTPETHLVGQGRLLAGCQKLTASMMKDEQIPSRGVSVAVLPMYGIVRFATAERVKQPTSKYLAELPRSTLGLSCDELLGLLASDPVQSYIQNWRQNLVGSQIQRDIEALVREGVGNLQEALSARQARLDAWEHQREHVQRCAASLVEQMDRRTVRGMASKLTHAADGAMPTAVQIFKWGYDIAAKVRAENSHGFDPAWDFEMAAIAFGDELELELRYIDHTVGELLHPANAISRQDFETQSGQSEENPIEA